MYLAIPLKKPEEIEATQRSALLVSKTLAELTKFLKPGITTLRLDQLAEEFIQDHKAIPAFKGYNGFPASLCTSVNDAVVHGIPGKYVIKEEDIISIDCGVLLDGWYGDSAYTFILKGASEKKIELCKTTLESLEKSITFVAPEKTVGDLGHFIQKYAESRGFSVVRELVGHGIGRQLHEAPEIPNYGNPGKGVLLREGMVFAIEPMINEGKRFVKTLSDNWTVVTADGKASAHYEHTVAVVKSGLQKLSSFSEIESNIKLNPHLVSING